MTVSLFIFMGRIIAAIPIINRALTIVLPITFARTTSLLPFINPWNDINNSGALVPKATILNEIIILGIFRLVAVDDMASTK